MGKQSRRARQQQTLTTTVTGIKFSGPLPLPGALQQYNQILPGAAERILAMAEQQATHRRSLEKVVVEGGTVAQARGQWMAFSLALLVIVIGTALIVSGKPTEGLVSIIGSLATLFGVFISGKLIGRAERRQKRKDLDHLSD